MLPEVVFLDVGDTLVRADPSWADVYSSVFPEFDLTFSRDDFHRALSEVFQGWTAEGPFEATEEASFQRLKELDSAVFARLGRPDMPDAFFRRVDEAFRARSAWWVFPDVVPALDALLAAGVRLGVISNWSWYAPELLHDLELARHFETLVISARVGYQKPHRGIFEHALEVMRVAPERAIHVGDSYTADVEGARAVGIRPVFIDRRVGEAGHSHGALPAGEDVATITDLFGLLDLLGLKRPAATSMMTLAS